VVAVDAADLRIGMHGELLPAIGKRFPVDVGGGVEIGFTAGFESGKIPAGLIAAAKLFMGHLYANREDVIIGTAAIEIPNGFRMMCGQYRMPVI
ncbi:MAG: head-tail connector protein, partial [Parasphingorhabdus sp.]